MKLEAFKSGDILLSVGRWIRKGLWGNLLRKKNLFRRYQPVASIIIIQHIVTLLKYGHGALNIRRP